MSHIYHGCFRKNVDGTNRIVANDERYLLPCSKPFWKYIEDRPSVVKTRNQYKRQELVNRRTFDTYFSKENKEDIEQWQTAPDSELRILKAADYIYVIRELLSHFFHNSEQWEYINRR